MKVEKRRIRFKLENGQWTEVRRYRSDQIKEAVIEETMSYQDAMKYLGVVK